MKTFHVLALAGGLVLALSSVPAARASAAQAQQAAAARAPAVAPPAGGVAVVPRAARVVYALDGGAEFAQGCFEQCACPVRIAPSFRGTFTLRRTVSGDAAFRTFAVEDVHWIAAIGEEIHLRGSGSYRVGTLGGRAVQELTLALSLNGAPPTAFASGLVPGGDPSPWPAIEITVDQPDQHCFERVLGVSAGPAANAVRYAVGPGSAHLVGCWDPCDCAVSAQNLRGSFTLVPVGADGTTVEFAVLDVALGVGPFLDLEPLPTTPIAAGDGLYRLWTDGSGLHELELDLDVVGAGRKHFESGLVLGAAFPALSIDVADEGFVCFNEVFALVSEPAP